MLASAVPQKAWLGSRLPKLKPFFINGALLVAHDQLLLLGAEASAWGNGCGGVLGLGTGDWGLCEWFRWFMLLV